MKLPVQLLLFLLFGCSNGAPTEAAAKERAHHYLVDHYPMFTRNQFGRIKVDDVGGEWRVKHSPPDGWIGGEAIVWVRKADGEITRFEGSQ